MKYIPWVVWILAAIFVIGMIAFGLSKRNLSVRAQIIETCTEAARPVVKQAYMDGFFRGVKSVVR